MKALLALDAPPRPQRRVSSTMLSSPSIPTGFEALRRRSRRDDVGRHRSCERTQRRDARSGRRCLCAVQCDDHRLWHGHHAAHAGHGERPADRQSAADARQYRQARRGHLPGARPFQRAGRPHGRHHRKARAPTCSTRIETTFGFGPPTHHGHDAVAAMQAMVDGPVEGVDLPRRQSRRRRCRIRRRAFRRMRSLDLAVHIATKLNRSHLLVGKEAIILPCLGRTERDVQASGPQIVTVEDSMSMVHASRRQTAAGLASICAPNPRSSPAWRRPRCPHSKVDWMELVEDYDRIRDKIEAVFPELQGLQRAHQDARRLPPAACPRPSGYGRRPRARPNSSCSPGLNEDPSVR